MKCVNCNDIPNLLFECFIEQNKTSVLFKDILYDGTGLIKTVPLSFIQEFKDDLFCNRCGYIMYDDMIDDERITYGICPMCGHEGNLVHADELRVFHNINFVYQICGDVIHIFDKDILEQHGIYYVDDYIKLNELV